MPPSTHNSDSVLPLSFSMASKMALVWKQVASKVARAMCPFLVYWVMPTMQDVRIKNSSKLMVGVSYRLFP